MTDESMTCLFADSDRANGYLEPWCKVHKRDAIACLRRQHERADIAEARAKIGELREPTQAEGNAHAIDDVCFVEFGKWFGQRCERCGRWMFDQVASADQCQRCTSLEGSVLKDLLHHNGVISAGRPPPFVQVGMVVFELGNRERLYVVSSIEMDPNAQSTLDMNVHLRDLEERVERVEQPIFFARFVLASPFVVDARYTGRWRSNHVGVAEIDLENTMHHPGGETRV